MTSELQPLQSQGPEERQADRLGGPALTVAERAHLVEQHIKQTTGQMRSLWVELARDLYEFNTCRYYKTLGCSSFEEWASTPDIEIHPRWAFELIALWKQLVIEREVPVERLQRVEPSKMQSVLPALRRGEITLDAALADAEALSRSDLRIRYGDRRQAKNPRRDTEPKIRPEEEPGPDEHGRYVQCYACGSWIERDEPGEPDAPEGSRAA